MPASSLGAKEEGEKKQNEKDKEFQLLRNCSWPARGHGERARESEGKRADEHAALRCDIRWSSAWREAIKFRGKEFIL